MKPMRLVEKWTIASKELGFEIRVDQEILIGHKTIHADILVPNFGGKNGTIIVTNSSVVWEYRNELRAAEYGFSVLEEPSDEANAQFSRSLFIEMLSEWEWTGESAIRPSWLLENNEGKGLE